ncbi:unnamed protein product [Effrenium voratum]|nr:unnamed protein product [Effrenium voratum]
MDVCGGYATEISGFEIPGRPGRLFLGSHQSADRLEELRALGIGLVINCTKDHEASCLFEPHMKYLRVAVNDNESAEILPYLGGAADAIAAALKKGESVLVHCMQGISRSVTICAAFLIRHCGLSVEEAIHLLQRQRPVANPNLGFRAQLQSFGAHKELPGIDGVYDEAWCRGSLAAFAMGSRSFASLGSSASSPKVMRAGLDFVLGRAMLDSDLRWYGALLRQVDPDTEMLRQQLQSEDFQECWGCDFPKAQIDGMYQKVAHFAKQS